MPRARARTGGRDRTFVVELDASLGLDACESLRKRLTNALESAQRVVLDASSVESLDTAVIQLLVGFVRDATARGREVSWKPPPEAVRESIARLDLGPHLGWQD